MAQSADQASVTGIITARQQKLLVHKGSKRRIEGSIFANLVIAHAIGAQKFATLGLMAKENQSR
jgi:hypothetical protein